MISIFADNIGKNLQTRMSNLSENRIQKILLCAFSVSEKPQNICSFARSLRVGNET